jgi:L-ornithine N5-monooxygenase
VSRPSHHPRLIATIGVGFGPAALGVAAALEDASEAGSSRPDVLFLERRDRVLWQPGMLLPDTDIQHHFLRDLATPRNPRSRLTFVNYLKQHERIYTFGEMVFAGGGSGGVSRLEWGDYIRWAADQLASWALLGIEVTAVDAVCERDTIVGFDVHSESQSFRCRNLLLASGPVPFIPDILSLRSGVVHSANYLEEVRALAHRDVTDIAIIGSGQSAIEIAIDVGKRFTGAQIHVVHTGRGFSHVDRSAFSNAAFHPGLIDVFHPLPSPQRQALLAASKSLNYGVVEPTAAYKLYREVYEEGLLGVERFHFHEFATITATSEVGRRSALRIRDTLAGHDRELRVDVIVACTGFRDRLPPPYADGLSDLIEHDNDGAPIVTRDYEVVLRNRSRGRVFVAGAASESHGASDSSSFSMIAERGGRIGDQLRNRRDGGLGELADAIRKGADGEPASTLAK